VIRARVVLAALLVGLGAPGCGSPEGETGSAERPVNATGSGTIVRGSDDRLWVASPDDRSVGVVEPSSLRTVDRISGDGTPAQVIALVEGVAVSFADRAQILFIDDAASVEIPCSRGDGMATWTSGGRELLAVACPTEGRVAIVDVVDRQVLGTLQAPPRTSEVTVAGNELVAATTTGTLRAWTLADLVVTGGLGSVAHRDTLVWVLPGRSASQLDALVATPAGAVAAYQVVDNERAADPTDPADTGSYASVIEGNARIEPALSGWCPHLFSDFSVPATALSGPSALAVDAERSRLWVVGRFTGDVVVLDCSAAASADGRAEVIARFEVGVGAAGIALSADGSTAWVDGAFDHSIIELSLGDGATDGATGRAVRELGSMTLTASAQQGRRLFNDATNVHLTPNRVVTCASCHMGGGEDGLNWRISTRAIATKYRRTPPLWGLADTGSLHWNGEFSSLGDLTTDTIHQLLGGDALLVDRSAIADWLALVEPPPAHWTDGSPAAAAELATGKALFGSDVVGCAACHDAAGVDVSDELRHDVVAPSHDPDGVLDAVRTPRLVGLAARAPYLHDGRAETLVQLLGDNAGDRHGSTSQLTNEQRQALLSYLRSR